MSKVKQREINQRLCDLICEFTPATGIVPQEVLDVLLTMLAGMIASRTAAEDVHQTTLEIAAHIERVALQMQVFLPSDRRGTA